MFDILVKWEDQTVNLCHITDFWITHTILVSKKTEPKGRRKGKICKIRSTKEVEVLWEEKGKTINQLTELRWENKEEFVGLPLIWASDDSWKGKKSKLRQYNPKKPKKWGCKLYMLCTGKYGIILKTELYAGKGQTTEEDDNTGLLRSSKVVWDLTNFLPHEKNFKLAFDNWFSSPLLMHLLAEKGIQSICTFQLARFRGLDFTDNKTVKEEGRGSFHEKAGLLGTTKINAINGTTTGQCI